MDNFIVRLAIDADAGAIADLSGILGYPVERSAMQPRLEKLSGRQEHVVFVAEMNGEIIGWIHGAERELVVADRVAEICGLVVAEGRRIGGVGRCLVEAVEEWALRRGL